MGLAEAQAILVAEYLARCRDADLHEPTLCEFHRIPWDSRSRKSKAKDLLIVGRQFAPGAAADQGWWRAVRAATSALRVVDFTPEFTAPDVEPEKAKKRTKKKRGPETRFPPKEDEALLLDYKRSGLSPVEFERVRDLRDLHVVRLQARVRGRKNRRR